MSSPAYFRSQKRSFPRFFKRVFRISESQFSAFLGPIAGKSCVKSVAYCQWEFQDPKMEVLYHISGYILLGYSLTYRPAK